MLLVLSPAKSLDFASPSWAQPLSQPVFARQAAELARVMRGYSPQGLAERRKNGQAPHAGRVGKSGETPEAGRDGERRQAGFERLRGLFGHGVPQESVLKQLSK